MAIARILSTMALVLLSGAAYALERLSVTHGGTTRAYTFEELDQLVGRSELEIPNDYIFKGATKRYLGYHLATLFERLRLPKDRAYVLVCTDGTVKVLDFGLAMVDENDEEFSMAMIFGQNRLGTADYISPEQYLDSYQVDPRADLYSLGCTFYFALTGKVPFPFKSSAKKLKGHLKKKPTPVQELRPEIPKRVAQIVAKMMAKHPDNRIQTAEEVVRYLKPHAERQECKINFRSVLEARLLHAGKRLEAKKSAKPSDRDTRELPPPDSTPSDSDRRQSTIETIVREDTMLNQNSDRDDEEQGRPNSL